MEVLDIGLERPYIFPATIVTTMVFMMAEVLECLRVMEELYLGLNIPVNIPLEIVDFIIMVIAVVITEEVNIGLKRPATLSLSII